ncbi:MAG TPA: NADH-quinone oxidoreductase subunit L, partial [Kofleriaceae bacterium]|nr:NADH-quinone oxidoreductase subunit L [Kofleriaceae bacterium]
IWVGDLKIEMAFRMDTLAAVMCLIVTGVGTLIHIYSTGYMATEPRFAAYFGYLNLFTGSMLLLVLGANLPVMFIGWEGVGMCSYLLIGFWFDKEANATAGRKAFIVNRIGDFAFILGMLLLYWGLTKDGGSSSLSFTELSTPAAKDMFESTLWYGERFAAFAGILLFIGAAGKSAQIPLYVWLPDAMAGPTPVSALIHAATMVTAGVYMVARMSYLYASSTTAMAIVAGIGALTALAAAFMAFAQTDLKKVLAYSTVSQLGFMFVAVGVGAYWVGIFHVATHAFFKAGLFLGAGSVMHAMSGSGDIMKMGGLAKRIKITHITFLIFCLAIAGFPLLSGFFSKDEIVASAFFTEQEGWWVHFGKLLAGMLILAAAGTALYMFRMYFLVFHGECRADEETQDHIHESPISMTGPLVVLAIFAIFAGLFGLPHLAGFSSLANHIPQLGDWIAPSVRTGVAGHASSAGLAWGLMGAATLAGLGGIAVAWFLYGRGVPSPLVNRFVDSGPGARVYDLSKNKLYVDEGYEWVFLKPFRWLARGLWEFADKFVIDLIFVNGAAFVVGLFGRAARWVQNGQVQRYLTGVLVGGALIVYFATRPSAEMKITVHNEGVAAIKGEILAIVAANPDDLNAQRLAVRKLLDEKGIQPYFVSLQGNAGAGPGAVGSTLVWYRDGQRIGESPLVQRNLGEGGDYEFELRATDGVFGNQTTVRRTVRVPDAIELAQALTADAIEELGQDPGGAQ